MLNHSVEAGLGTTTFTVTLKYTSEDNLGEPPVGVAGISVYTTVPVPCRALYGQLAACTRVLVLTVVRAVATSHELLIGVDFDVLLRQPYSAVFQVLGVVPVDGVDAGHRYVLLAVAKILNSAELPSRLKLVPDVQPPVEVEEVYLH